MSSSDPFSQLPSSPSIPVQHYKIHMPTIEVEKFTSLIHLSPLPPGPPLTSTANPLLPIGTLSPSYLAQCRDDLLHSLEHAWRTHESQFNSYPNFLANIRHENHIYDIHFLALFSQNKATAPETVVFLHGYPSSPFSFLPILDLLRQKYTPQTLPFHVLIPSLPGFGFSSSPPDPENFSVEKAGQIIDSLLRGLGLQTYTISANDLGSFVARKIYANEKSGCTALHLSMIPPPPRLLDPAALQSTQGKDEDENLCLRKLNSYMSDSGSVGMNLIQGLRPGLVGLVAGSHPLGVLGWVGSRIWEWSDTSLLDDELFESIHAKVLQTTALYFFTQTLQRCLWFSREMLAVSSASSSPPTGSAGKKRGVGYSLFTRDIVPTPEKWALETLRGEIRVQGFRAFRKHERGGHFACWEVPGLLLGDVEEFVEGLRG